MGDMHRVPQLLQEMKADKVEALVVTGFPVGLAAKTVGIATVVAFGAGDPVATGLVQSLSRPGGNITGISDNATELSTKRLSLLKQLNPKLRRVAMLWNKDDLGMSTAGRHSHGVRRADHAQQEARVRLRRRAETTCDLRVRLPRSRRWPDVVWRGSEGIVRMRWRPGRPYLQRRTAR
jgi:hypothetical protein